MTITVFLAAKNCSAECQVGQRIVVVSQLPHVLSHFWWSRSLRYLQNIPVIVPINYFAWRSKFMMNSAFKQKTDQPHAIGVNVTCLVIAVGFLCHN